MKKIIFTDVDGTLVDYSNMLPESAKYAVQTARSKGHEVVLVTGRAKAEIQTELFEMGFDGLIGGNGSYIEYHNQVVSHEVIPYDVACRVVDWLLERDLPFYLESNNGLFASEGFEYKALPAVHKYMLGKGSAKSDLPKSVVDAFVGLKLNENIYRDDLIKISFVLNSYQDHLDSKDAFPELVAHTWGGKGELALFGDLGIKGIDKKVSILKLLSYIERSLDDCIAFGDAAIDIPMFECCPVSVAMGNAGDACKVSATFVTSDVEADGFYKAFERLELLR